ncbi:LysR family transcriptional regulator [Sphingomonas koreensis]|jgi:DNA-binding transcriptional LysR family regulator|uniref:LysR family transcriptional regulator n=1 Tax=Sphingomonas koreensis TaxID=93064 RepID=A0A1L6J6B0_9SPHN|nr:MULTISPECIES: LysR family transcriptional regulator [Alphaproteobacteria]APR51356.1 LysR family transcriptional regulator [Sphingomonas koreensis]RSU21632.1 LysR family transcriptional regulator [Sphingomonas koreensis]RSU27784.1 LysR family transcriptional regulator [Sphingomonas koreensis]RSU29056.1 LysR family transcriptional regulator [Sphingomonas koreensis]RSU29356.1 LysR family transcriptional regulator [Sphingomonas koreensis]
MAFDIRQLRYAIAAADHGSFYRAARALDVEQSTLSRAISKLERSIGMPIFERSRAGVRMTLAGTAFIRGAKPMVATADKLVAMMRAAGQGRAGGLMLGHNSSVSAGNLRATMMSWRDANPDVEVQCVEADRSVLLAGLDTGEIDIAILMGATSHDGFRCEPLWSERMLAALPATHPLTERDVVHWTDLRGERFYLPAADPGAEMRDMLLGRLAVSGVTPDIQMHQCSRETILSILGGGSAVSIVCEGSTGARYPDLVYRPIHGEQGPALAGYAGYWRDENRNPALRRFLGFIKMRYALSFDFSHRLQ